MVVSTKISKIELNGTVSVHIVKVTLYLQLYMHRNQTEKATQLQTQSFFRNWILWKKKDISEPRYKRVVARSEENIGQENHSQGVELGLIIIKKKSTMNLCSFLFSNSLLMYHLRQIREKNPTESPIGFGAAY